MAWGGRFRCRLRIANTQRKTGATHVTNEVGGMEKCSPLAAAWIAEAAQAPIKTIFQKCHARTAEDNVKNEKHVTNSPKFTWFIGIIITVNAVTIGLEVDLARGTDISDRLPFFFCEVGFGLIFFAEMLLKLHLSGWSYFLDRWNVVDYHLVIFSFLDIWTSLMFAGEADMKIMSAFRIVRILRLARSVRFLHMFRELWMLVQGFFETLASLFWVLLLLFIILYAAAIFLTIFVASDKWYTDMNPYNDVYFGSLIKSMWTLFQVVTFENWAQKVVRPLGELSGGWYLFFLLIMVLCALGVLNVITAVIVERTLSVANENEKDIQDVAAQCEKLLLREMGDHVKSLETDTSGELHFEEFKTAIRKPEIGRILRLIDLPASALEELFFLIDVDNSSTISADELVSVIQKVKGTAKAKDMILLISYGQRTVRTAVALHTRLEKIIDRLDIILERLDGLSGITEAKILEGNCRQMRMDKLKQKVQKVH